MSPTPQLLMQEGTHAKNASSPGRFYAAHVGKTIIVQILSNYDLRFKKGARTAKRNFSWRCALIPYVSTELQFRERKLKPRGGSCA